MSCFESKPLSTAQSHRSGLLLLAFAAAPLPAWAGPQDAEPRTLDRLQVTATRSAQPTAAVPAAISVVDAELLDSATLGVSLSEKLALVPGLLARNRHNYAQDEQVSIRGFGTRSAFGIRGVRLYLDGIPATMPDGQGQLSHFQLATAERIEVLRGPFSALYGNASGGVLQLFTADGQAPGEVEASAVFGGYGQRRLGLTANDAFERVDYRVGITRFDSDGYREHSRATRESFNGKANIALGDSGRLTLVANVLHAPDIEDPQGLTRAQFDTDPRQASAGALAFDTRKSVRQRQLGAVYEHEFDPASRLRVLAYGGEREVSQVLSIPVGTQRSPLSGGGIIAFESPYRGVDARWTVQRQLAGQPVEWTVGLAHDRQQQDRSGFENFVGDQLGVRGALRLRQYDTVESFDQYAQMLWRPHDAWSLMAGMRRSEVRFRSDDRFITERNPDDSGRVRYDAVSPVLGASVRLRPALHAYAAYGEGFETPTFNEISYRGDGGSGLNFELQPARTRSAEAGLKLDRDDGLRAELAVFRADTRQEITAATSAGGRTTFQNAGRARRRGVELSAMLPLAPGLRAWLAATYLDARFVDAFLTCSGVPCRSPDLLVPAGRRIPGVPRTSAAVALHWGGETGWQARVDGQYLGAVPVAQTRDERAPAYAVFGASVGYGVRSESGDGRVFVAVQNLADRRYAGSIIVNESNGRHYEPAPDRHWLAGFEWRWRD
ncbi:TonB-dependent receptor family protein [Lysobacter korlensis]|uniref:TonB-dependent receptor family protein n=1 Tax=Lysobacter korlensis TaxID=553636 RepID=A0ABV6RRW1_9GAMM